MKRVFINYKKARFNLFIRTIYYMVSDRLNGGTIFEKIKFHFFHFLKFHDFLSIKKCFFTILIYCFGGRLIRKILGFDINNGNELIISQLSLDNWGRYREENGRFMMPVSVRLNHAIADGYLIALVFKLLQEEISRFSVL